jgi:cyanate lyase
VYTPGKENSRADALSRRPDIIGTKEVINTTILKQNEDRSLEPARTINRILKIRNDIPKEQQEAIIRQHNDDTVHGHPRIARIIELIRQNYKFSKIKNKVTTFIAKYEQY